MFVFLLNALSVQGGQYVIIYVKTWALCFWRQAKIILLHVKMNAAEWNRPYLTRNIISLWVISCVMVKIIKTLSMNYKIFAV